MAASTVTHSPVAARSGRRARLRLATLGAAVLLAVVAWAICVPVLRIELIVGAGSATQPVSPILVVIVPLIAGGAAWGLLAILERLPRGITAWRVVAWVVLALSLLGPITMTRTVEALLSLVAMHVVVGIALIVGLPAIARRQS